MTSGTRVGYRFHPTDEELVNHFLKFKMQGKDNEVRDIAEVDVCKWEPWELPRHSVVESDDPEWFFFCPWKSTGKRTNRATQSGYWKSTGKDRKVKARRTNNVIATKKTLVFYRGRVPNGLRTDWVIHEYHPVATPPHQTTFVVCRLKKKTDEKSIVSTFDEGEASSYTASDFEIRIPDDTTPEAYIQSEPNLESLLQGPFQLQDYDIASSLQVEEYNNSQGLSFLDFTDTNGLQSDANEEEDNEFLNSLFVDQDEYSCEEIIHHRDSRAPEPLRQVYFANGGLSSDTDTDTAQTRYGAFLGTSSLFNEHVGRHREARNDDSLRLDASHHKAVADTSHQIFCMNLAGSESSQKVRTFTPQHQRRSRHFVAQRAAQGRSQPQKNSLRKSVDQDKAKDASRHSTIVDRTQKEKSISDSDKAPKMAQGTNAKKSSKPTSVGSVGSNRKGCFTFQETSLPCHDSSPPSVYFFNVLVALVLFVFVIREVVLYGKWC